MSGKPSGGRPGGIGKYESARGAGLTLRSNDGPMRGIAGLGRKATEWCFLCDAEHGYHRPGKEAS